jgi:hypothetical protein
MIEEFFRALFQAGIPVAITSFLLAWWALKNGYIDSVSGLKEFEIEVKRLSKAKSNNKKNKSHGKEEGKPEGVHQMNPVHNKWLRFGGGFYGVVGLLTYAVVELGEIRDFFVQFDGLTSLISGMTAELLIGFFVNSIINFIVAITWPIYWLSDIRSDYIWIWFVLAYLGYWAGSRFALHRIRSVEP